MKSFVLVAAIATGLAAVAFSSHAAPASLRGSSLRPRHADPNAALSIPRATADIAVPAPARQRVSEATATAITRVSLSSAPVSQPTVKVAAAKVRGAVPAASARKAVRASRPSVKPKPRRVATRRAVAERPGSGSVRGRRTIASWYNDRPAACWGTSGRVAFPRGLAIWTAHKTLPCGTAIVVTGPSGRLRVRVYDRGPYVRGRELDLSAAAFRAVCGSTSRGVCRVSFSVA